MISLSRPQHLKKRVLLKIYVIWFFRRILPLMVLQILVLTVALKIFARQVFFAKVFENAAMAANDSYWAFFQYLFVTFFQTRFPVQIIILVLLGVGALILRDLGRTLAIYLRPFVK